MDIRPVAPVALMPATAAAAVGVHADHSSSSRNTQVQHQRREWEMVLALHLLVKHHSHTQFCHYYITDYRYVMNEVSNQTIASS